MSARNTAIHVITKAGTLLGALFLRAITSASARNPPGNRYSEDEPPPSLTPITQRERLSPHQAAAHSTATRPAHGHRTPIVTSRFADKKPRRGETT